MRELRPRDEGDDWEVRLEPPVNRVLPVASGEPWARAAGQELVLDLSPGAGAPPSTGS